jgi:hypothetical protein
MPVAKRSKINSGASSSGASMGAEAKRVHAQPSAKAKKSPLQGTAAMMAILKKRKR